jgi:lysophospholipase L1-like esterase
MTRLRSIGWLVAVNILVTALLLELVLRVQQKIGPLYDLDLPRETVLAGLSDELNHVQLPWADWDSNGIRRMDEPNSESCLTKLLFMGDSFMEGLGPKDTVPYHARATLSRSWGAGVCVFNAGTSSYSPSIFIPQAKKLIPLLRPDIVIIDVDETDIYDDWYRYRELVVRDDAGSITAVGRTPVTAQFQQGLIDSTDKTLYLHRLISKLYFTRIAYPRVFARYTKDRPSDLFVLSRISESEAQKIYADQIAYFEATLDDLTKSVLRLAGEPERLVYIHHPHLEHLKADGASFNNIVSAALRKVASRHHVRYYDATEDMKVQFGNTPENYYIPNDMHFNEAGLRAYAVAVSRYLAATPPPAITSSSRAQ